MSYRTIWDGLQFDQVSPEECARLVKEDKAQDVSAPFIAATDLKFRKDFTGYLTRELRAAVNPEPPDSKAWRQFRKAAAEKLGKAYTKTTKQETLDYMESINGEPV